MATSRTWRMVAAAALATTAGCAPARTDVNAARLLVPAEAPDSVPAWVLADSSWAGPTRYIPLRFTKNIVGAQFKSDATLSQRQSAIDRILGRVVGGYRAAGIYLVWVKDPGDGSGIMRAVERLEALPYVAGATPDLATTEND